MKLLHLTKVMWLIDSSFWSKWCTCSDYFMRLCSSVYNYFKFDVSCDLFYAIILKLILYGDLSNAIISKLILSTWPMQYNYFKNKYSSWLMQCNDFKIDSFIMWLKQWNGITISSLWWKSNLINFQIDYRSWAECLYCWYFTEEKRKLSSVIIQ